MKDEIKYQRRHDHLVSAEANPSTSELLMMVVLNMNHACIPRSRTGQLLGRFKIPTLDLFIPMASLRAEGTESDAQRGNHHTEDSGMVRYEYTINSRANIVETPYR